MKRLLFFYCFCVIVLGSIAETASSQSITVDVPVGKVQKVHTFETQINEIAWPPCREGTDYCEYNYGGFIGFTLPKHLFFAGTSVYYFLTEPSTFNDTINVIYSGHKTSYYCPQTGCGSLGRTIVVHGRAYYDTAVSIGTLFSNNGNRNRLVLYPDQDQHYKTEKVHFDCFGFINDTVLFSDWSIITTPAIPINITAVQDSIAFNSITSLPFEGRIPIDGIVSSSESTRKYEREYNALLNVRARTSSSDSIYSTPIVIILTGDPTSDVLSSKININKLQLFPIPSNGVFKISLETKEAVSDLSIFDLLGNKLRTLNNSPLPKGEYEYNLSLPPGVYYLRCESEHEVITKKIVIQ